MSKELLEKIAASVDALAAKVSDLEKGNATLAQAQDAGVTKVEAAKDDVKPLTQDDRVTRNIALMEKHLVNGRIESLVQETKEKTGWPQQWVNLYRKQLVNAKCATLEDLEQTAVRAHEIVAELVQDAPQFPGRGFNVQKDKGERGFKNGNELLDELVSDLPDDLPEDGMGRFRELDQDGNPLIPGYYMTPRRQLRKYLDNIARYQDTHWDGPAAVRGLIALSQGYSSAAEIDQVMTQSCADGTTSVGAGGAPSSAIFIFPLVRRIFPQLIVNEIASVQPMDRPNGKIFYLDTYRVSTGVDSVDEGGNAVSNRMRIDRSDSFSSSYSDDPGECNTANKLQLRLSSKSVDAVTKKLFAEWTIEEMQDLRAYHGLDAALELVGGLSRQIALEWNQTVLNEMVAGATAGNRTYGTTAPSGYTQKEWDEYITRYLEAANTDVFKKRSGPMTHIIAGPDAWLKMSSTTRVGTVPYAGANPTQYPGLVLTPFMAVSAPNIKTYMTNFWTGVNTNKILVLRRGADWSDTPYVWAPYLDYVSPTLTLPDTFKQQQGIMSRSAHKIVVSDAMATISIAAGTGSTV